MDIFRNILNFFGWILYGITWVVFGVLELAIIFVTFFVAGFILGEWYGER